MKCTFKVGDCVYIEEDHLSGEIDSKGLSGCKCDR